MIGTDFLDYVSKFQIATYVGVEDFADKFNFLVTVMILMICTTIVTVKQYMMKPISCYMATDLGGKNLLDYVENYCWVQGTVPIAYAGKVPETDDGWTQLEGQKLLYYQWVPFMLGLQGILFYLPRLIWQMICYNRTGTDVQHLVLSANQAVHATDDQRTKLIQHLAKTLEKMLFQHQKHRLLSNHYCKCPHVMTMTMPNNSRPPDALNERKMKDIILALDDNQFIQTQKPKHRSLIDTVRAALNLLTCTNYTGATLSIAYLILKVLYLCNTIGQLFLMQRFLGFTHVNSLFGLTILNHILNGQDWQATLIFPRVAYCYVPVKNLGVDTNTVISQCVLPVNMLNEKIYIFLWWWILLIAVVNFYSFLRWALHLIRHQTSVKYVTKFIQVNNHMQDVDKFYAEEFAKRFLRRDGIFLIRILTTNVGELVTAEIVNAMWSNYLNAIHLTQPINNNDEKLMDRLSPQDREHLTSDQIDDTHLMNRFKRCFISRPDTQIDITNNQQSEEPREKVFV